jgi:hypothetical protein
MILRTIISARLTEICTGIAVRKPIYLFIVYLTMLLAAPIIQGRMVGLLIKDELERLRKEVIVVYLRVLSRLLPGGTGENHVNFSDDCRFPDSNRSPAEYK